MKRFIVKIILVTMPLLALFSISFIWSIYKISSGNYFSIKPNIHYVFLGHSHSACAVDDNLIEGFINLSQNTEGYPYTYFKVKKILEENESIRNLFVEYTNNQISPWAVNRISGIYIDNNMPRMFPVLSKKFIAKSFNNSRNVQKISRSIVRSYKNNYEFLLRGDNYINDFWNKHETPKHIYNSDSSSKKIALKEGFVDIYSIERENISYLFKIKKLCIAKNVNLILVRSPIPNHIKFTNEDVYKHIKASFFS